MSHIPPHIHHPTPPLSDPTSSPSSYLTNITSQALNGTLSTILSSFLLHILSILFGAPLFKMIEKTWVAATFVATIVVFPMGRLFHSNSDRWITSLSWPIPSQNSEERFSKYTLISGLAGAWFGVWPIPVFYGTPIGYLLGSLIYLAVHFAYGERNT
ncbi:GPI biosynthesis protein family Pig-F-domain-containing protein, partial [Chytridium lagenaria]